MQTGEIKKERAAMANVRSRTRTTARFILKDNEYMKYELTYFQLQCISTRNLCVFFRDFSLAIGSPFLWASYSLDEVLFLRLLFSLAHFGIILGILFSHWKQKCLLAFICCGCCCFCWYATVDIRYIHTHAKQSINFMCFY